MTRELQCDQCCAVVLEYGTAELNGREGEPLVCPECGAKGKLVLHEPEDADWMAASWEFRSE